MNNFMWAVLTAILLIVGMVGAALLLPLIAFGALVFILYMVKTEIDADNK